jgi:DNA modification methylase
MADQAYVPAQRRVIDPFMDSGTIAVAVQNTGQRFMGSDINPQFIAIASRRPYLHN